MDSILNTVKNRLGINLDDDSFNDELITIINGELAHLAQIGVGPKDGIEINDDTCTWSELIGDNKRLNFVKDYISVGVKLVFDYPTSGGLGKALEDRKHEYEWRLNFEVDPHDCIP